MLRKLSIAIVCLLYMVDSANVLAMGGNYDPGGIVSQSHADWPKGLVELINSRALVCGHWINATDFFFYRGDVDALNQFIASYSELTDTPLTVILHAGTRPLTGPLGGKGELPYDWKLTAARRGWGVPLDPQRPRDEPGYVVTIDMWLSDAIALGALEIPANVELKSGGEIDRFIELHPVGIK